MSNFNRRQFLGAAGAGVLAVGFSLTGAAQAANGLAPTKSVAQDALDSWLTIDKNNRITLYVGKVDLGTGTKTALSQIAADELDVGFGRIDMVMGDTGTTPDQWLTGAAITISQGGSELRIAAANARQALLQRAAKNWGVPVTELVVNDGVIAHEASRKTATYGSLIGSGFEIKIDPKIAVKKHTDYKLVGQSVPRVDIPAKVTGEHLYVHDLRLPGMLHARVIRPTQIGASLQGVDDSQAKKIKDFVQTVRQGNFLAVVAKTEWAAIKASDALKAQWSSGADLPAQATIFEAWRKMPVAKEEATQKVGDVSQVLGSAARSVKATYNFAVQTHASIGPSCAVADFKNGQTCARAMDASG